MSLLQTLGMDEDLHEREVLLREAASLRTEMSNLTVMQTSMVFGLAIGRGPKVELPHENRLDAEREWDLKYAKQCCCQLNPGWGIRYSEDVVRQVARKTFVYRAFSDFYKVASIAAQLNPYVVKELGNADYLSHLAYQLASAYGTTRFLPTTLQPFSKVEQVTNDFINDVSSAERPINPASVRRAINALVNTQVAIYNGVGDYLGECLSRDIIKNELLTIDQENNLGESQNLINKMAEIAGRLRWEI